MDDPRTTDAAAAVHVEGLVREFKGGIRAVDGLDLEVRTGEIYGFLGPNGAGKTTLVRILTTLLRPTSGVALVAGRDVVREADLVRREIGVALQEAAIDPLMTGRELLRMQGALHGLRSGEGRDRAEQLLDRVGLTEAGDRRVGGYSGGCGAASISRSRSSTARACSSSTSPPRAWTPRAGRRCGTRSVGSTTRGRPSS